MKRLLRSEEGSLLVALSMGLTLLLISGLGVWGFLRHWRHLAETQLRLDRCVGGAALELSARQNRIIAVNREIRALRVTRASATLLPAAIPALEAALVAEVVRQEFELTAWRLRSGIWQALGGCDRRADLPTPLPALSWVRDPPDELGPQELRWLGSDSEPLHLQLNHSPRVASAWVFTEGGSSSGPWKSSWTRP